MRTSLPILYASHDGQTRKIVTFLAEKVAAGGPRATLIDLSQSTPEIEALKQAKMIVFAAPIRYGYPLKEVDEFIRTHRNWLKNRPTTLVLVNLTARKEGKNTPETNLYMRKWVAKLGFKPTLQAVFAGRLDYNRYLWWEKRVIQFIMWMTKGPTNLNADIEFTAWDKVDALAQRIITHCATKEEAA